MPLSDGRNLPSQNRAQWENIRQKLAARRNVIFWDRAADTRRPLPSRQRTSGPLDVTAAFNPQRTSRVSLMMSASGQKGTSWRYPHTMDRLPKLQN